MSKTLLLFDVDGTLLLTGGAGVRAMDRAACRLFGSRFTWDGIQVSGHLDPLIFAEAVAVNGLEGGPSQHRIFRDYYLELLEEELTNHRGEARSVRGIDQTLEILRPRSGSQGDVVLGLLTGNYTKAVPIKLTAAGIDPDWFKITAFGDEAPSRSDLVLLAMDKYREAMGEPIHPGRVIVIGDTPRDVACAHAHGCVAFAVATGRFGTDELTETGAEVVVQDLTDPQPLLELIASCLGDPGAFTR